MNDRIEHRFETHTPVHLYAELGKGSLTVVATDTTETVVELSGRDAEEVHVAQDGDRIEVVAPRNRAGFFSGDSSIHARITLPRESEIAAKTGSADITLEGTVGSCQLKTGSGDVRTDDVTGPMLVETGSGDIAVGVVNAELRVKSGSGDVRIQHAEGAVAVSTGSGDVEIGTSNGPAVVKTGSGDLKVVEAQTDVSLMTGSGDLVVGTAHKGRFTIKGASGDVRIGIPAGIPVWTDISTISGSVRSDLSRVGEPAEGADHIELHAKTVSGDVVLTQV